MNLNQHISGGPELAPGSAPLRRAQVHREMGLGVGLFVLLWSTLALGQESSAGTASRPSSEPALLKEPGRFSERASLERGVQLYLAGQYENCVSELGPPLVSGLFATLSLRNEARFYFASCALLEGDPERARGVLRAALEEQPLLPAPDSLTFPPPLLSLFLEVRDEVAQLINQREEEQRKLLSEENEEARRRADARRLRVEKLEKLAREETLIQRNSRWYAALPLGTGQYLNGNRNLGHFFFTSELLGLGTTAASGAILLTLYGQAYRGSVVTVLPERDQAKFDTSYRVFQIASLATLALYGLGVLEAELPFVPERKLMTRARALPPELEAEETSGSSRPTKPEAAPAPKKTQLGLAPGPEGTALGLGLQLQF